jgi:hypothetical protein
MSAIPAATAIVRLPHSLFGSLVVVRVLGRAKEDVARVDTRIDDLRTEMIDQFEHVEKQFRATHDRLRDISAEIAVIHRRVERLEELGASNAGFAKEIDHLFTRVAEIEKHLGIDKKIAA